MIKRIAKFAMKLFFVLAVLAGIAWVMLDNDALPKEWKASSTKMLQALSVTKKAVISGSAGTEIYKCVENGRLTISDAPCPPGATGTVVPSAPQTPRSRSPADEPGTLKQKLDIMQRERQEREGGYETEQKYQDEIEMLKKLQKMIEAKKQMEAY
jgi:hypothetical protein